MGSGNKFSASSAEQNKVSIAAEGNVVAKPVEDGEEIIESE